jgi:GPH family glycoside/pentoside/hexuronide:cation symporter
LSEKSEEKINNQKKFPLIVYFSFAFGDLMIELFVYLFGVRVFSFYENRVLLHPLLILAAYVIYTLWNMINDPLIGYVADKPKKFWDRFGKRRPWIIVGGIGISVSFILIFAVPDLDPVVDGFFIFLWLLLSICLFDTFFSFFDTNYNGLIPDKFRTDKQRLKLSGFEVGLGIFGSVLGSLVGLIIDYESKASFVFMAVIFAFIGLIILALQQYGIRETKEMKQRYVKSVDEINKVSFIDMLKICIKQRSFVAYLILFTLYQATIMILLGSIPYLVDFILNEDPDMETVILLGYILAGLLSIPIWSKIAKKAGNKKVFIISGIVMALLIFPFFFANSVIYGVIAAALMGVGLIGFWLMSNPVLADVIDEAIVNNKVRQEGLYMGVRIFFARIAILIQALTFTIIHITTGFNSKLPAQTDLALIGLRIQMAIIPVILMLLGVFAFWKLYDISPEKKKEIKQKLSELNL